MLKLCIHRSNLTGFTGAGFHLTKHQCGQSVQCWFGLSWKSLSLEFQCWSGLKNVFCMVKEKTEYIHVVMSVVVYFSMCGKMLISMFQMESVCLSLVFQSCLCFVLSCLPLSSLACVPFTYLNPAWSVWVSFITKHPACPSWTLLCVWIITY